VPSPTPEVLALMTSGLTAAIALEQVGHLHIPPPGASSFRPSLPSSANLTPSIHSSSSSSSNGSSSRGPPKKGSKVVLVTAAAGGTGQFAVQLAKLAGCHVVATCGGADKAALLQGLGADRVINYR
jgi:NADPH-dependent curcumin reductase CurA